MNRKICTILLGSTFFVMAGSAIAASPGPNSTEVKAFHFRAFQTEMMVAALKCRDSKEGDVSSLYNNFISKHRSLMAENAQVLKAYFKRVYAPRDAGRMDNLMTRLANDASQRAHDQKDYCGTSYTRLRDALALDQHALVNYVADRSSLNAITELAEAR